MYVQRNIEARLCNHCGSSNAIYITYSESVFVALVTQNTKRRLPIVICGLYNIFPHYLINGSIFEQRFIEYEMCVFSLSTTWSEIFLLLRRIKRDMIKIYIGLLLKYSLFLSYFIKFESSRQIFEKYSNMKFHENPSSGHRVLSCGRRGIQT